MTQEEFVRLVKRLEPEAAADPTRYRWKVVALGALAYAFIGTVLFATLGLLGALVAALAVGGGRAGFGVAKVGWVLIAFAYAVARSLWVRIDLPDGIRVEKHSFPRLFAEVEEISRKLGGRVPHQILIDEQLNAAMSQHPRLGVLGWPRNSLILGLPYLHAVTLDEARTTIAHEFGHMAGSHGRAGAWVYRVRKSWSQLLTRLEAEKRWSARLFRPFFRWHAPYFNAYSFVLARLQEYEADRRSVLASDARSAADDLLRFVFAGHSWRSYWRKVWDRADDTPVPDVRPFAELSSGILATGDAAQAQEQLEAALRVETGYEDTHPSLSDRLAALGQAPRVPPAIVRSAAQELLGEGGVELAEQLDERWKRTASGSWKQRFDYVAERRAALAGLEEKKASKPLEGDEAFEHASLVEELRGVDEALVLQQALLEREPQHVSANLAVGRILLERGDEAGLVHLENAIARSYTAILPSWRVGWEFLHNSGQEAEAERWLARAREHEARAEAAEKERSSIPFRGRYAPHGLSDPALSALRASIARHPDVERAWLVRRQLVQFDAEEPQWVLCAERRRAGLFDLGVDSRERDRKLQSQLRHVEIAGDVRILVINHVRGARKIFRGVPAAEIYAAESRRVDS